MHFSRYKTCPTEKGTLVRLCPGANLSSLLTRHSYCRLLSSVIFYGIYRNKVSHDAFVNLASSFFADRSDSPIRNRNHILYRQTDRDSGIEQRLLRRSGMPVIPMMHGRALPGRTEYPVSWVMRPKMRVCHALCKNVSRSVRDFLNDGQNVEQDHRR